MGLIQGRVDYRRRRRCLRDNFDVYRCWGLMSLSFVYASFLLTRTNVEIYGSQGKKEAFVNQRCFINIAVSRGLNDFDPETKDREGKKGQLAPKCCATSDVSIESAHFFFSSAHLSPARTDARK